DPMPVHSPIFISYSHTPWNFSSRRIQTTPRYVRYPTSCRITSSRYVAKRTFGLVCSLWAFTSGFAVELWCGIGVSDDISHGEFASRFGQFVWSTRQGFDVSEV